MKSRRTLNTDLNVIDAFIRTQRYVGACGQDSPTFTDKFICLIEQIFVLRPPG